MLCCSYGPALTSRIHPPTVRPQGGTYGGSALGCAAAAATLDVISEENLLQNATQRGQQMTEGLLKLSQVGGWFCGCAALGALGSLCLLLFLCCCCHFSPRGAHPAACGNLSSSADAPPCCAACPRRLHCSHRSTRLWMCGGGA